MTIYWGGYYPKRITSSSSAKGKRDRAKRKRMSFLTKIGEKSSVEGGRTNLEMRDGLYIMLKKHNLGVSAGDVEGVSSSAFRRISVIFPSVLITSNTCPPNTIKLGTRSAASPIKLPWSKLMKKIKVKLRCILRFNILRKDTRLFETMPKNIGFGQKLHSEAFTVPLCFAYRVL